MLQIVLVIAPQMYILHRKLRANNAKYFIHHPDSEYFQNFLIKYYLREGHRLEDPDVDGRIILRCVFRKWDVGVWTGSSWVSTGTGGGHL
jgi:hypothetical protein